MGHDRRYRNFGSNTTPREITDEVMDDIAHSGDRYGSQSVKFLADKCDSYDDAYALIEKKAEGEFYPAYAVQYKTRSRSKTDAVIRAEEKRDKLAKERADYVRDHSVHQRKSEFITCPSCGSKLANARFSGEHCPVCRTDLRPKYVRDRLDWYAEKQKMADKAVTKAYNHNKITGIAWLVMYELHI